MKEGFFENALKLSAEELAEICNIKAELTELMAEEKEIKEVRAGFQFLEVEIYNYPKNLTFKIEEDANTHIHTSVGLVRVGKEIGAIILKTIKEKQEKEKYINVKLLPL